MGTIEEDTNRERNNMENIEEEKDRAGEKIRKLERQIKLKVEQYKKRMWYSIL